MLRLNSLRMVFLSSVLLWSAHTWAFKPPEDTSGTLKARIEGPAIIEDSRVPVTCTLVVKNSGTEPAVVHAKLAGIDGWRIEPETFNAVPVLPGGDSETRMSFRVIPAVASYSGFYPVHAWVTVEMAGQTCSLHPILLSEVRGAALAVSASDKADPPATATLREGHPLPLARMSTHQSFYELFSGERGVLPAGWQGNEGRTRLDVRLGQPAAASDGTREAISIHPPWYGGLLGTGWIEFPLALPDSKPIWFRFANAVRQTASTEPPSDGVTFRVRVATGADAPGVPGRVIYELNTGSKAWVPGEVDLSEYSGQTIRLQLESHPGPKHDLTCDLSYWGSPLVEAGTRPAVLASPAGPERSLGLVNCGASSCTVSITPGTQGLLNASVRFSGNGILYGFQGYRVRVCGDDLGMPQSMSVLNAVQEEPVDGRMRVRHRFSTSVGPLDLMGEAWVDAGGFRTRFWLENAPAPEPWQDVHLEDVSAGPWDVLLKRVYAGVGNVIDTPKAFVLGFDGHRLATSFVGYEWEKGGALLQGVDVPPLQFEVSPETKVYTLHAAGDQTLTFVPASTVWDAVKVWRDTNSFQAGGGVPKVAGRFVFDLWGGRYADTATVLKRAFSYGLTNSMVMWHNWQRWGYDYRLPDIWPPNPDCGTLDDFKILAQTCKEQGVLFLPHDNYIDAYPDSDSFSYEKNITFNPSRTPDRGWLNEGNGAQAYRWRPDRFRSVLESNLAQVKANGVATGYFIDVFSSARPGDFWTSNGQYHDAVYTRTQYGEAFAWIRTFLGDNAPQISESGHDQLMGYLDGAQTNHLRVGPPPSGYYSWATWDIGCADAERVPWIDAAHHQRFILHGAGYEERYRGGLDPALHGMHSNDYIATEVLTGHPAMTSVPFGRDSVRKYWLLDALMRGLSLQTIESVEFDHDNIHRQHVRWSNGNVWVNRGDVPWEVSGHTLPQYGFFARVETAGGVVEAAYETLQEQPVEWSHAEDALFINPCQGKAITLNGVTVGGALRVALEGNKLRVLPLPETAAPIEVSFNWSALPWTLPRPTTLETLEEGVGAASSEPLPGGQIEFVAQPGIFGYRLGS